MPAEHRPGAPWPGGTDFVQLIPSRVARRFGRLEHGLYHTLRTAQGEEALRRFPEAPQTRYLPSVWGARRDDYRWGRGGSPRDVSAFRSAAAIVASALLAYPGETWGSLLPGRMDQVFGRISSLFLADYWVLTLHHLVWSRRLPYATKVRWERGTSVRDVEFCFVSTLSVDLAEASQDALILFQEAVLSRLAKRGALPEEVAAAAPCRASIEPPAYCSEACETPAVSLNVAEAPAPEDLDSSDGGDHEDTAVGEPETLAIEIDSESFTVRRGGDACHFGPRHRRMFELLERINRRPGYRVSFDDLRSTGSVWDGSPVEDCTIRGAATRLRKILKAHGFPDLAKRIVTRTHGGSGYVMLRVAHEAAASRN